MPFLLRNLTLSPGEEERLLRPLAAAKLGVPESAVTSLSLVRKGVDARKKGKIKLVYTVQVTVKDESRVKEGGDVSRVEPAAREEFPKLASKERIVIVGMGPAGLFAALRLAEYGLSALVLERGREVEKRAADVSRFWRAGELLPESNVQFGEGGAGTFSDGKLTTRVKDENCGWVLRQLVHFGAPPEILYAAKPHIGTDRLRAVVKGIRERLIQAGFEIRFESRVSGIGLSGNRVSAVMVNETSEHPCDTLLLAPGHSARDTYAMLHRAGVALEAKPFAVGLRVEHPQALIDEIQYGRNPHPQLPPAEYAQAYNNEKTGRSAYSFCMCPGGVVVAAASEAGGVVVNGMSGYRRNGPGANSALVVTVGPADFPGASPLSGIEFQRDLERRAFAAGGGGYLAPAQSLMAFLGEGKGRVASSYRPGVVECELTPLLPPAVAATLKEGIRHFDRKMRGFMSAEATLTAVETRTSAPLRILRAPDLQSVSHPGLYPTGEGAGYAGGIMSAALDGIRVADAIAARLRAESQKP
ncbi:FAD-dependent oxidoreductase, putative [Citrifermentans bemidjiense Bem]|uniref:FAD-dependent oxidoreductase, putative n=1 Tax=Citrifermentans bemidjiense (strain ATCC BAA-1014 / DSM 16622 / JCM 12645 / Bem) TaxID=404380 RepID=B5E9E0_CITBB|nr:hypothetical protein [Citrifermentans bemidjiense]ACH38682.1 FAD-dependent oxidoreductase, putative [Citrifermentans bemidjiense Bem]